MTCESLKDLLISYEQTDLSELWNYDYSFFMLFYDIFGDKPFMKIPDVAFMFMEIDGWQGMCQRCGVWQYYENISYEYGKAERVITYLKSRNEDELAGIYAYGIHDYCNYEYKNDSSECEVQYPQKWLDESEKIGDWIMNNEEHIYKFKRNLILSHKSDILNLAEK